MKNEGEKIFPSFARTDRHRTPLDWEWPTTRPWHHPSPGYATAWHINFPQRWGLQFSYSFLEGVINWISRGGTASLAQAREQLKQFPSLQFGESMLVVSCPSFPTLLPVEIAKEGLGGTYSIASDLGVWMISYEIGRIPTGVPLLDYTKCLRTLLSWFLALLAPLSWLPLISFQASVFLVKFAKF